MRPGAFVDESRQQFAAHRGYNSLVIDLTNAALVGITSSIAIEDIIVRHNEEGKTVYLAGLSRRVRRDFARLKILQLVPEVNRFRSRTRALRVAAEKSAG